MNTRSTLLAALFVAGAATFAAASGGRDGAVIENSGSTNARGYSIKVWSDGRASAGTGAESHVAADLVQRFFSDVRAEKAGSALGPRRCMKSASFGSTTIVHYHGWSSADLACPGSAALSADVRSIAAAAGAGGPAHPVIRRPLLPNEHRRPEGVPATQPSASPESARFVP